jgi:hypothetical protein
MKDYTVGLFIWALDDAFCLEHTKAESPQEAAASCVSAAYDNFYESDETDGMYTIDDIDVLFVFEGTHEDVR